MHDYTTFIPLWRDHGTENIGGGVLPKAPRSFPGNHEMECFQEVSWLVRWWFPHNFHVSNLSIYIYQFSFFGVAILSHNVHRWRPSVAKMDSPMQCFQHCCYPSVISSIHVTYCVLNHRKRAMASSYCSWPTVKVPEAIRIHGLLVSFWNLPSGKLT